MQILELRVSRQAFAGTLGALRQWIDNRGGDPVKFETASEGDDSIVMRIEFSRADLETAFRQDWPVNQAHEAEAA